MSGGVGEPRREVVGRPGDGGLEGQRSRVVFRRRGPGTCIRWTAGRPQVQAAFSEPLEGGRTAGGGGRGTGCAGRRRARQGGEIEPSTAPQTLAIAGCTTQPEQEENVKTSLNRIFRALTCSRSLASSTMAFS